MHNNPSPEISNKVVDISLCPYVEAQSFLLHILNKAGLEPREIVCREINNGTPLVGYNHSEDNANEADDFVNAAFLICCLLGVSVEMHFRNSLCTLSCRRFKFMFRNCEFCNELSPLPSDSEMIRAEFSDNDFFAVLRTIKAEVGIS